MKLIEEAGELSLNESIVIIIIVLINFNFRLLQAYRSRTFFSFPNHPCHAFCVIITMYITTSPSLLGATTPKLLSSSPSRTFVFPPSFTPYSSRNSLRSSLPRWSHRLHHVSPFTLRPPIRAVAPAIERFHREIANTGASPLLSRNS
ncbi:hypothetical protein V8G54_022996 [Vigna mungo]|uniref:Uncharacterized protein n=1 Tax=Vigna mungo TaxID=3915 RepID=A0AAQ3N2D0_VIGMU